MGNSSLIENMIEARLLNLHTAFIGKVLSVEGEKATVQPLTKIKQIGENAKEQAPIPNVPIFSHCKGRTVEKELTYVSNVSAHSPSFKTIKYLAYEHLIKSGDIVICICCERDISKAIRGDMSTPALHHHSISDCVIVGVL